MYFYTVTGSLRFRLELLLELLKLMCAPLHLFPLKNCCAPAIAWFFIDMVSCVNYLYSQYIYI